MEVSTVNFPGFVLSKLITISKPGLCTFQWHNAIKHCYIAAVRKMLNYFVWALLVRYQLVALYRHICLQSTNESAILHYLHNRFIRITMPLPMAMSAEQFVYWLLVTIQQLCMPDTCMLADGASRTNQLRSAHMVAILQGGFTMLNRQFGSLTVAR
jgi:hypothetical protein